MTTTLPMVIAAVIVAVRDRNSIDLFCHPSVVGDLLKLVIVPLLPLAVSLAVAPPYALWYGFVLIATIWSLRILVVRLSAAAVLRASAAASVVWQSVFLIGSYDSIQPLLGGQGRLGYGGFHPNTLGFVFATFVPAQIWVGTSSRYRLIRIASFVSASISVSVIVLASSRGSLLGLATAACTVVVIMVAEAVAHRRPLRASRILIAVCLIAVCGLYILSLAGGRAFVDSVLDLDNPYRGFGSGLTGRTDAWAMAVPELQSWWFSGAGYRTSADLVGAPIDNGYLTVWLEQGVVPTTVIVTAYITVLLAAVRQFWRNPTTSHGIAVSAFMIVMLVNNIFARYLFGIGNPGSLFALLFFVAGGRWLERDSRTDVCGSPGRSRSVRRGVYSVRESQRLTARA